MKIFLLLDGDFSSQTPVYHALFLVRTTRNVSLVGQDLPHILYLQSYNHQGHHTVDPTNIIDFTEVTNITAIKYIMVNASVMAITNL